MRAPPLCTSVYLPGRHEALYCVWRTHADTPTGAFGDSPSSCMVMFLEIGAREMCLGSLVFDLVQQS